MPAYDYHCQACGFTHEVIHAMADTTPQACPRCRNTMRRVIHATPTHFSGTGFYQTDYRGKR